MSLETLSRTSGFDSWVGRRPEARRRKRTTLLTRPTDTSEYLHHGETERRRPELRVVIKGESAVGRVG